MNLINKNLILTFILISIQFLDAQTSLPKDWYMLDKSKDGYYGVSAEKTISTLLKDKPSKTVVVAILDSGVDYKHEDLKDNMWVNPKEIPNNGKDDDKNGYIDDIHGWNFIGGKNGENVSVDNYEVVRLYGKMKYKFANADPDKISSADKKDYATFLKIKEEVESRRNAAKEALDQIEQSESLVKNAIQSAVKVIQKIYQWVWQY